ncbi:MAG: hypothetical protein LQ350_003871 [Teloschistes chrysophthalmus]|nr:MAG: hypothetical protein LQ350_003871 [Niorma chrysophthalma]
MDNENAVLIGLPLVLGLIFCGLWMNPYFVLDADLRLKCINFLGYIAVFVIWIILLWEWVVSPSIRYYQLMVQFSVLVIEMISRFYWLYLDPLVRERPRRPSQSDHQDIAFFQAAARRARRAKRGVPDQNSDQGSSTTYKDSTDGDSKVQLGPFNDSGIFVDSESSPTKSEGAQELGASEEMIAPPALCKALMLYPKLHVTMPVLNETPPQPTPSPSKTPPKFRDSITLRKEQLATDAVIDTNRVTVVRRRPRVRQFKDPPSPPKTPTLNQYTISPGRYSKDLEEEFGDLYLRQGSPRSRYSRKSSTTTERSVSSPRRMPSSSVSSPLITEEPCDLVDNEDDDSLIIID